MWVISYITEEAKIKATDKEILELGLKYAPHPKREYKVCGIRILGNMCANSQDDSEIVINNGGLDILATELQNEENPAYQIELCWAISNITAGTTKNIAAILNTKVLQRIIDLIFKTDNQKVFFEYENGKR